MREDLPPEIDSPARAVGLRDLHLVVVHGTTDHLVSETARARQRRRLDDLQLEAEFRLFDGGHRLDKVTLDGIADGVT